MVKKFRFESFDMLFLPASLWRKETAVTYVIIQLIMRRIDIWKSIAGYHKFVQNLLQLEWILRRFAAKKSTSKTMNPFKVSQLSGAMNYACCYRVSMVLRLLYFLKDAIYVTEERVRRYSWCAIWISVHGEDVRRVFLCWRISSFRPKPCRQLLRAWMATSMHW